MKFLVVLFVAFVSTKASIIGLSPLITTGSVIKGASATGVAVGLDGSVVTAVDGATVVGVAPARAALASAVLAPRLVGAAPLIAAAPVIAAAPAVVAAAPSSSAVIAGPSGAIAAASGGGVAVAPAVAKTVIAAPGLASASIVSAPVLGGVRLIKGHGLYL